MKTHKLYQSLKRHLQYGKCPTCSFYQQYGVMIVKGDMVEHITDIAGIFAPDQRLDRTGPDSRMPAPDYDL